MIVTMASSDTYSGPAVLITEDGEMGVRAELWGERGPGMPSWRGHVTADPGEDLWPAWEKGEGRLRLPDGQEGRFVAGQTTAGSDRMTIEGSGPAPF